MTGESTDAGGGFDYAVAAYDVTTGQELWVTRLERGDDLDVPVVSFSTAEILDIDIAASPAGDSIFVTGHGSGMNNPFDRTALAFALDPSTGAVIWSATRTGPLGETGHELMLSPDGQTAYVAGQAAVAGGGIVTSNPNQPGMESAASSVAGYLGVAYDATGTEEWVAHYGMVGSDATYGAAAISADGSLLYLTGTEFGDFQTVAYPT